MIVGDLAENVAKRVVLLTDEFYINEIMLQAPAHTAAGARPDDASASKL